MGGPLSPSTQQQANIVGLEDQPVAEQKVHGVISQMAPQNLPSNGIFFLPEPEFIKQQGQLAAGHLGNRAVQAGAPSEENFGGPGQRTRVNDGFSVPNWGQMFLNASLLKPQNYGKLQQVLAHELGHFNGGKSEEEADRSRDMFLKRAQAAQKIEKGVAALPNAGPSPDVAGALSGK